MILPVVALFELRCGYAKSHRRAQMEEVLAAFLSPGVDILPFDALDAAEASAIRADLESLGTPIGPYDILIAAQARRRGAALVTLNRMEFERAGPHVYRLGNVTAGRECRLRAPAGEAGRTDRRSGGVRKPRAHDLTTIAGSEGSNGPLAPCPKAGAGRSSGR